METRANYILVGSFVLLLVAGVIVFIVWLAKFQFDREFARYDIYFSGKVSGLKLGSSVNYRGIPVGEVIHVGIDPANVERVLVTIEVPAETPVRQDTVASLELQGITGGGAILLAGGTQQAAALEPAAGQRRAVIPSRASQLEQFLEGAPELVESLNLLVSRAAALLSDDNRLRFDATLDNVTVLSTSLANRSEDFERLVADTSATLANLRDASASMATLSNQLRDQSSVLLNNANATLGSVQRGADTLSAMVATNEPQATALVDELRRAAERFSEMADKINDTVDENRGPLRDFSSEGLLELTAFLGEARALLDGLNRVTTQVERDPARFLFGDQQQGYETAQ